MRDDVHPDPPAGLGLPSAYAGPVTVTARVAPSVHVRGLSIELDHEPVLSGLDLDVPPGEITVLMGASGAGKSVLIKQMVGLLAPDAGVVVIGGTDIWGCSPAQLEQIRRQLSVLHGGSTVYEGSVFASLSVREQLLAGLHEKYQRGDGDSPRRAQANPYFKAWSGWTPKPAANPELLTCAQEWLDLFDLAEVAELHPHEVSSGLRRRAALAAALAVDVPLYVLDDPDGAIDESHRRVVTDALLRTHHRTGATMLVTTHDAELAAAIADQVAVLAGGRIVYQGRPEPAFERLAEWYGRCGVGRVGVESLTTRSPEPIGTYRSAHDQAIPESTGSRRRLANAAAIVAGVLCLAVAVLVAVHLVASLAAGRF